MSCSNIRELQITYTKLNMKSSKGECNLKNQEKIMRYINNTENPYILKIGNIVVEIKYSNNGKTFNECMVNILKQKRKWVDNLLMSTLQ